MDNHHKLVKEIEEALSAAPFQEKMEVLTHTLFRTFYSHVRKEAQSNHAGREEVYNVFIKALLADMSQYHKVHEKLHEVNQELNYEIVMSLGGIHTKH